MSDPQSCVSTDEHGTMRVGKMGVMLDGVLVGFHGGDSPESIRQQYPSLTLEEVYGAITWYLAHQAEGDAYLERQHELWEKFRIESEAQPSPVVERLRAIKAAKALKTS